MPDFSLNSLERSAMAALQRCTNSANIALFVWMIGFSAIRYAQSMKRSVKDSEARLFAVAETQGGFFTAKQAEDAGFDRTHHAYHVRTGNWVREHRGVYRLTRFPMPERPDLILWSLWSRNRDDQAQGIYSHQTALSIYDLSDVMPAKLHMTVPRSFRRNAEIPHILILHYDDLSADEVEEREGYRVTSPIRTIVDVRHEISDQLLSHAFNEAKTRGLVTGSDVERYRDKLPGFVSGRTRLTTA
jgi:predicted transcriptional regulator of viral defense system